MQVYGSHLWFGDGALVMNLLAWLESHNSQHRVEALHLDPMRKYIPNHCDWEAANASPLRQTEHSPQTH